jgi:hypothetical protein
MAKKLRCITVHVCRNHAKEWIVRNGRVYGAPCVDRAACDAAPSMLLVSYPLNKMPSV